MMLLALPVIAAANRLVDDPACRAAANRRTSPLARCMNLAPPFTGTRTVTNLMRLWGRPRRCAPTTPSPPSKRDDTM